MTRANDDLNRLVSLLRIMAQLTQELSERHRHQGDILGRLAEDLERLAQCFDGVARAVQDDREQGQALH